MPTAFHFAKARSILSVTRGFIAQAGFTHSLTPARNCTYGCSYCYVPTLGFYGGLKPADWQHWGEFTTFKSNAAPLLFNAIRGSEVIYCSPLVDPYQPAEKEGCLMPGILDALAQNPPSVFAIQTRGPLILRDMRRLQNLAKRTTLRVSFSITTNRDHIRRKYEPHCATIEERFDTVRQLRLAGIETFATLAPLLPCDPELLIQTAVAATETGIIADPLHIRDAKKHGATTRATALRISERHGFLEWHDAKFQAGIVERMRIAAEDAGRYFAIGAKAFSLLSQRKETQETTCNLRNC